MPPIMKPIQVSAIMTALSMGPFADFILSLSALAGLACNEVVTHTRSFSTATFGRLLLGAFGVEEVSKVKCSSSAWQRLAFIARGWPRLKARALEGGYLLGPCYTECWDLLWCVTAWPTAYFFLMLAVGLARAHRFRQGGCSWLRAAMMGVQTCPGVHIVHLASLQFVIRFPLNRLAAQFWPGCSGGIPLTPSTSYVMLEGPLGWVPYISGLFVIKAPFVGQFSRASLKVLFIIEATMQAASVPILLAEARWLEAAGSSYLHGYSPAYRTLRIILTVAANILLCAVVDGMLPSLLSTSSSRHRPSSQPDALASCSRTSKQQAGGAVVENEDVDEDIDPKLLLASMATAAAATSSKSQPCCSEQATASAQPGHRSDAADVLPTKGGGSGDMVAAAKAGSIAMPITADAGARTAASLAQAQQCIQVARKRCPYRSRGLPHFTATVKIDHAHVADLPHQLIEQLQATLPDRYLLTGLAVREGCVELLLDLHTLLSHSQQAQRNGMIRASGGSGGVKAGGFPLDVEPAVQAIVDALTAQNVLKPALQPTAVVQVAGSAYGPAAAAAASDDRRGRGSDQCQSVACGSLNMRLHLAWDETSQAWKMQHQQGQKSAGQAATRPSCVPAVGLVSGAALTSPPPPPPPAAAAAEALVLHVNQQVVVGTAAMTGLCRGEGLRVRLQMTARGVADASELSHVLVARVGMRNLDVHVLSCEVVRAGGASSSSPASSCDAAAGAGAGAGSIECATMTMLQAEVEVDDVPPMGLLMMQLWGRQQQAQAGSVAAADDSDSVLGPVMPPALSAPVPVVVVSSGALMAEVQQLLAVMSADAEEELHALIMDLGMCLGCCTDSSHACHSAAMLDQVVLTCQQVVAACIRAGCPLLAQHLLNFATHYAASMQQPTAGSRVDGDAMFTNGDEGGASSRAAAHAVAYSCLRLAVCEDEGGLLPLHLAVLSGSASMVQLVLSWESRWRDSAAPSAAEAAAVITANGAADGSTAAVDLHAQAAWQERGAAGVTPLQLLCVAAPNKRTLAAKLLTLDAPGRLGLPLMRVAREAAALSGLTFVVAVAAYTAVFAVVKAAMPLVAGAVWLRDWLWLRDPVLDEQQAVRFAVSGRRFMAMYAALHAFIMVVCYFRMAPLGDAQSLAHAMLYVGPQMLAMMYFLWDSRGELELPAGPAAASNVAASLASESFKGANSSPYASGDIDILASSASSIHAGEGAASSPMMTHHAVLSFPTPSPLSSHKNLPMPTSWSAAAAHFWVVSMPRRDAPRCAVLLHRSMTFLTLFRAIYLLFLGSGLWGLRVPPLWNMMRIRCAADIVMSVIFKQVCEWLPLRWRLLSDAAETIGFYSLYCGMRRLFGTPEMPALRLAAFITASVVAAVLANMGPNFGQYWARQQAKAQRRAPAGRADGRGSSTHRAARIGGAGSSKDKAE